MSPLPTDRRPDIDEAIRHIHEMIDEALGYIERQEDGPMTMRAALKDIRDRVDTLESEINVLFGSAAELQHISARLIMEREAAIQQYNMVIELVNRRARRNAGKTDT